MSEVTTNEKHIKSDLLMMDEYYDMLLFYLENPEYATEELLGIKITPPEQIVLDAIFLRGMDGDFCQGRAMAKTFEIGICACLIGGILSTNIGVWSGSDFRGGKMIFEDAIDKILLGDLKGQNRDKNYIGQLVKMKNEKSYTSGSDKWVSRIGKSKIITAPVTVKIRGYRTTKNFIDERNTINEESVRIILTPFAFHREDVHEGENVKPLLPIERSQILNFGTPSYTYYPWSDKIMRLREYYREDDFVPMEDFFVNFNFLDAFNHALNIPAMIKELNDPNAPEEELKAEILAIPIAEYKNKFYNPVEIESLPRDSQSEFLQQSDGYEYSIGVDCSSLGYDKTTLSLIKRKIGDHNVFSCAKYMFDTKDAFSLNPVSDKIKELFIKFPSITGINIDSRGGGSHVRDLLATTDDSFGFGLIDKKFLEEKESKFILKNQTAIIHLITVTDELNTRLNLYVRNKMTRKHYHIIDFDLGENGKALSEENLNQKNMQNILFQQYKNIYTDRNKSGFLNFYVKGKKKKDLYSADLYSFFTFMEIDSMTKKEEIRGNKKRKCISQNFMN